MGTGRHIINYNAEIGDDIYITPSFLAIRIEPNEKSEKLITLNKNTKVELIEKKKNGIRFNIKVMQDGQKQNVLQA